MSDVTDVDNRQWRIGANDYRYVTVKGANPETFEAASLLQFDVADGKYKAYTGGVGEIVVGIINLDEAFILNAAEGVFSMCIQGDVWADKLDLPGAFVIDDNPNASVLSIRDQLRDVGIIAQTRNTDLTEDNINP